MQGLGDRMRARARELGWSDAEVARRVGLSQGRYANYITDRYEPDIATLLRICSALGMSTESLLGTASETNGEMAEMQHRIASAVTTLNPESLKVASILIDALVARSASLDAAGPPPKPATPRRKPPRD